MRATGRSLDTLQLPNSRALPLDSWHPTGVTRTARDLCCGWQVRRHGAGTGAARAPARPLPAPACVDHESAQLLIQIQAIKLVEFSFT
jgi:hypothetical protein